MNYSEGDDIIKKIMYFIFILFVCLFPNAFVFASDNSVIEISSMEELKNCLKASGICKLTQDIQVDSELLVDGDVILDLNGHTIAPDNTLNIKGGFINIGRGAKLTINDNKGSGLITTGNGNSKVWAAIQIAKDVSSSKLSELVVNGGTIEGYYYGITGNGNSHNTKITINDGVIRTLNIDDSVGIYNPQMGDVIINNGSISGGSGVEIRSGNLIINNGTISGVAPSFTKTANTSGSTINGAGVSIAQHTTKNPINVTINNGNISGQYALYEWNPHNNSQSDLNKVKIDIKDGKFRSLADDGSAIYSQNFKNFISGGSFNTSVSEYLIDGANVTTDVLSQKSFIEQENNKLSTIAIAVISIISFGFIGFIFYKKAM